MAYTALEKMRMKNETRFGKITGPVQPPYFQNGMNPNDLKSAALRFLRERCEELLFDPVKEDEEQLSKVLQGKSLSTGQIPYNMEMDINRLCLEKSLEAFIDSGVAEDAYTVYYCYLEMFLNRYGNSKKMVELLSEYELNGSSLLLKHRDHYSHSVYVFALGLAVYETNDRYREIFSEFYNLNDKGENAAAHMFLEYWGLTSLFHDIGYPFELPFEQVQSYFEVEDQERGKGSLFLAYHDLDGMTALSAAQKTHFHGLYDRDFDSISELLAHDIFKKLGRDYGFSEEYLLDVISSKAIRPDRFGYYMDHAFFSAARLYKELAEELGAENLTEKHVDALSAIILHNSLFKFSISFYKDDEKRKAPLKAELHPLAWLLMLCDELQCWDRIAYGRNSRKELHPMSVDFDFNSNSINAVYYYDQEEHDKIDAFKKLYREWESGGENGKPPRLKAYSDMAEKEQRFTADIERIIDLSICPVYVKPDVREVDRKDKHTYLSNSNFLHLYDLAVVLHGRNMPADTDTAILEEIFISQSLEYQLSGINRAKSFSRYLNALGCFYTDRPVDYEMVKSFRPKQIAVIAPMEHERWIREHQDMGWIYGTEYETVPDKEQRRAAREQLRCHKLALDGELTSAEIQDHYFSLPIEDQGKDWKPFNSMLRLLKKYDGLRIYKL